MNKKQFTDFFNKETSNLTLEKQIELLEKIQDVWIPQIIERKKQNYTYCPKCKKYIRTKSFMQKHKKEFLYADVLEDITYSVCPNCGLHRGISRVVHETKNEHERN